MGNNASMASFKANIQNVISDMRSKVDELLSQTQKSSDAMSQTVNMIGAEIEKTIKQIKPVSEQQVYGHFVGGRRGRGGYR